MLKQMIAIALALFLVVFGANRINQSKATLTSNYLVINSIEGQNLEEILNPVKFHIPSFAFQAEVLNLNPYENAEGKTEVFIGNALYGDVISPDIEGKDCFNNNYLFTYSVNYNNTTKTLTIEDLNSGYGEVRPKAITKDGKTLKLMQMQ